MTDQTGASLEAELEALLAEPPAVARERAMAACGGPVDLDGSRCIIFGAGIVGRGMLAGLRSLGIEPLAFADNNPALWGQALDDLAVLSPADAAGRFGDQAVFVVAVTMWGERDPFGAIRDQLATLGCNQVVSAGHVFWRHPEVFIPFGALAYPDGVLAQADAVRACYSLLADDASRREYLTQLRLRLMLPVRENLALPPSEVYFPDDLFALAADEVFVDCGAYDGDVIRNYLARAGGQVGRIFAIEPDPASFAALQSYVDSLPPDLGERITTLQLAVSDRREQLRFAATGKVSSSVSASGEVTVDAVPLDELLEGEAPTFLKMDLEGAEPAALEGAQRTIAKHGPLLAICVYHEQDHLWRLPLQIASYSAEYRYFLRSYGVNGVDTICYAVPADRLPA